MQLRSAVVIALIFTVVNASPAQDSSQYAASPRHILTLSTGLTIHSLRDELLSPLIYQGTQAPIVLSYRFRGTENRHTILLSYDHTELHSSITRRRGDVAIAHFNNNLHLACEYTFSTRALEFDDLNTSLFVGGRFSSILNLRDHFFLQDKDHMSAEQITGLGLHLLTETPLQSPLHSLLSIELSVPCLSYALLNRRYNANVSEEFDELDFDRNLLWQLFSKGDLVSFNRFFGMQAEVSYMMIFGDHMGADLRYRLLYYTFAQEGGLSSARVLNDQFLIGVTVTL